MLEFIKFELNYRFNRPVTYIYFLIVFLMSFLATATDVVRAGGSGGKVMENAPVVITALMLAIMIFAIFITSAVMGVPVLRDFEHKTDSMVFTTPVSKWQYLSGKFIGSFIIVLLISSGLLFGTMFGQAFQWPWKDNMDNLMAFNFMYYWNPYVVFVLPNLFIFSAIFFLGGSLGKRMTVVYAQGIILFMGYLVAQTFLAELDNQNLAALLDPFGFGALAVTTQYWTVAEQNSQFIPFSDFILYNRLIWGAVGIASLVFLFIRFNFQLAGNASRKTKKKGSRAERELKDQIIETPAVQQIFGLSAQITQIRSLSWFYFRWIVKQVPFISIALAGVAFVFVIAFVGGTGAYDIELYMTSSRAVDMIGIFNLFFIIITVFYTGEIVWKERDVKMNLIYDALPFPNYVSMASKFLGMVLMSIFILIMLMTCGILIQLIKGYPVIEWNVYLTDLFGDTLLLMILYLILGLFIQALVNHKFVGFGLMFAFYISMIVLSEVGIEHAMFYFGRASVGNYSEMNQYGHYLTPFSWFNLYWFGLAAVFYAVAILFTVRGIDSSFIVRLKLGKQRLTKNALITIVGALIVFAGSGAFIYYNTNVLNEYQNSDDGKADRARYERTLNQYEWIAQPKIIDTYVEVDLFPKTRDFKAAGYYVLKNKSTETIDQIHIQKSVDGQLETNLSFEGGFSVDTSYDDFKYVIFNLDNPLAPGDSVKMNFDVTFTTVGFKESGSNTDVIYNGTFFNNTSYFPSIGYNSGFELGSDDDRKEQDLEVKERMMETDDPRGIAQSLFGDDADKISFEVKISTDSSQIAIAPGYLQDKRYEGDRVYYHYKMDTPMVNFYSIVSADYEVIKDTWQPPVDTLPEVNLEIYYNKGHEYNTERMMNGMKEALTYYTNNFSPYQFRQLRIMEFPKYRSFAQSFANTVPFSEGIGFIQQIKTNDVDLPFYVTAHEVAHQWWGHQVTEAGVKGNAMLSETLSQYSALMVMKKNFKPEIIKEFLKHELNSYLMGRTFEQKKEMPLYQVEGQGYIHYRKGSLVMYALQDYIGEDSVNAALKRFNQDWAFKDAPYPTSKDLISYYREVTPDSLQYIITDMFETITLFENKTTEAEYEKVSDDEYLVDLTVSTIKYQADSQGNEEAQELKDWIDIGVFAEGSDGKDSLIYLQKHQITQEENTFTITVGAKPAKAGIDPINKLIDRNPKDNVKTVTEKEEEAI
ncbi:ABC transporter permease/M1 family aminopeptidase [Marinoscillum sp.]|uniref:ABC transporter permease/M1 family aminopeptidase n=1 Tax=Marinoscillum sp. TaxID=2024838 RepID=UPI003BAD744B